VNGVREIVSLKIDPAAVDPKDVALLEDLVVAAVNQGVSEANKKYEEEMQKIAGGVKIPGFSI
jgi:hypothetical protein